MSLMHWKVIALLFLGLGEALVANVWPITYVCAPVFNALSKLFNSVVSSVNLVMSVP